MKRDVVDAFTIVHNLRFGRRHFIRIFNELYGELHTAQHELRMSAYSHIQDLEMQWFSQQSTGSLMAIMNDDVNQLERFLDQGAAELD